MEAKIATHVMIDIETLGTKPGCVILSIGACTFAPAFARQHYYRAISKEDSCAQGFTIDVETLEWWNKQAEGVRDSAFSGTDFAEAVLVQFARWLKNLCANDDLIVWSKGSNFDFPILEAAFNRFSIPIPWNFRNVRDYRTLEALLGHKITYDVQHNKHDALSDAVYQASNADRMLNVLDMHINSQVTE